MLQRFYEKIDSMGRCNKHSHGDEIAVYFLQLVTSNKTFKTRKIRSKNVKESCLRKKYWTSKKKLNGKHKLNSEPT